MEDVLDVYARPHDPKRPLVCFDETNKEQHIEVIEALPAQPGEPKREESTYERNGVSNLFMFFAPLETLTADTDDGTWSRSPTSARNSTGRSV